jgi:hypothetical protein
VTSRGQHGLVATSRTLSLTPILISPSVQKGR